MNSNDAKKILSIILSFILVSTPQLLYGFQGAGSEPTNDIGNPTETVPMNASELQALVAPIALYPDALVAQILAASTFPDQVAIANYWLQQNKSLTGSALMQAVDKQSWDPSVKALTEFPSVLDNMAKNLTWTSSLGEAYHNQQAEVMTAIQTLRAQAKAKGNLKSSSQITVVQQSPQTIVIQSANPQIVYVPAVQPRGDLRISLCNSRLCYSGILYGRYGSRQHAFVRRWDCGWRNDERRMLRLGIQQLELRLARHGGHLSRRRILRQFGLARRLLQRWLSQRLWLQQCL